MLNTSFCYRELSPSCAALDAVWTLGVRQDLLGIQPYLTLPDGCVDLIYRLKRDGAGRIDSAVLLIAGPTDRSATFFPTAGEEFVGIRFAPGWGGAALGVSAGEIFGTFTGARQMTSRLARLEEHLFACTTQGQATSVLHDAVQGWTHENTASVRTLSAIRMLRISGGRLQVGQAARHLGVSARSFRRDIKELTGLSPKTLSRIFRFRRSVELLKGHPGSTLCDVALQAGYTDQAHMSREFKTLGGFSPGSVAYLANVGQVRDGNR